MATPKTDHTQETNRTQADQIPPAAILMQRVVGFWELQTIRVAAELGIADLIHQGQDSAAAIAEANSWHEASVVRLLRAMVTVGLLETASDGRFRLSGQGDCLRSDVPYSLLSSTLMVLSDDQSEAWSEVANTVRTGKCAFHLRHGMPVFEYYAKHPDRAARFNAAMRAFSANSIPAVVSSYDFSDCEIIADIGGGEGHLLAAILKANPSVRGIVYDLPETRAVAEKLLSAEGLQDRTGVESGDMFRSVPAADTYVMKWIIHDWNDEECIQLLEAIRAAIKPGGRVLIIDAQRPANDVPSFAHLMDMNMMAQTTGRERSAAEVAALYAASGFEQRKVIAFDPETTMSIFEGIPK